ncbi:MAG: hydrogenase 3 maturation endopeptidase HyCI [Candidatus Bathyarchaeota archaeon]|nr:hydrogenase 3 maturation endopeptidase HyCI [Candidatus Bathyarchaeota archaeon]
MSNDLEKSLKNWFIGAEKVVVAGIGNPVREDDYVGLKIVEQLQGKLPEDKVLLIEAETVPESYLLDIEEFKPTHVLLIDAAMLGLKPGEARLYDAEAITNYPAVTTHIFPLRIFCEYIKRATGAKIALLLVEPRAMEFGEGLSMEAQEAAEKIEKILIKLLG